MWETKLDANACPRCTALLGPDDAACPRCGEPVAAARAVAAEPSAAKDPDTPGSDAAREEKTVACWPNDLDQLARAESVDGWTLLDTTVDPRSSGKVLAHFYRPARRGSQAAAAPAAAPAPRTIATPTAATKAREAKERKPAPARAPRPRDDDDDRELDGEPERERVEGRAATGPDKQTVFVVVLFVVMAALYYNMGWPGLLVGLWFVVPLLRKAFDLPESDGKRRRGR